MKLSDEDYEKEKMSYLDFFRDPHSKYVPPSKVSSPPKPEVAKRSRETVKLFQDEQAELHTNKSKYNQHNAVVNILTSESRTEERPTNQMTTIPKHEPSVSHSFALFHSEDKMFDLQDQVQMISDEKFKLQLELTMVTKRLEQLEKMEQAFHLALEQLTRSEA